MLRYDVVKHRLFIVECQIDFWANNKAAVSVVLAAIHIIIVVDYHYHHHVMVKRAKIHE